MHDGKRLIHAFDGLCDKYRKRVKSCRHAAEEETVHKLRISTRRLLASIELFQKLTPKQELRKLRKELKARLDAFDELRDTQVMLQEISPARAELEELSPFLHHLEVAEQRLSAQTPAIIHNMDSAKLETLFKKTFNRLVKDLSKADLTPQIIASIDENYSGAMERYEMIDVTQPATIHRTRIAVKKLRYMLEAAQILLPPLPENHLKEIHSYLTSMGEIQDSSVLLLHLKTFYSDRIPFAIQKHYQRRHSEIINAYMMRREKIKQFWRSDAKQPFPWKIKKA